MEYKRPQSRKAPKIQPRLIIHGGAGNITPSNLPPELYKQYHNALLSTVSKTHHYLLSPHNALDTVTFAVTLLEDNPLFNSGHGAVFTRDGINELEASIMVSSGKKKRGVGLMGLRHVKNPIKLAREMLIRGEGDLEGGNGEHRGPMKMAERPSESKPPSGGAQGHCQLFGEGAERLARKWGLEMVEEGYFFVQKRWDEHVKGLERERTGEGQAFWDAKEYVPQGTCGAVALDEDGVCAVATSTGGMTNKLTGRIGDTPTLGAGFWAEEWEENFTSEEEFIRQAGPVLMLSDSLKGLLADCLPSLAAYVPVASEQQDVQLASKRYRVDRATAMSGTGNGDSFLRLNAVRTASAIARYRGKTSLQEAVTEVTGSGGELEKAPETGGRRQGKEKAALLVSSAKWSSTKMERL